MRNSIVIAIVSLGAGIGIGAWMLGDEPTPEPTATSVPTAAGPSPFTARDEQATVNDLWDQLEQESRARRQLEQRVRRLSRQLAELAGDKGALSPAALSQSPRQRATDRPSESPAAPEATAADPAVMSSKQALRALGLDQTTTARLADQMESVEMDRLFLRDRAVREGWINTSRYRKARSELENKGNALVTELGENNYDKYLYMTGQSNRVVVSDVLAGSPARQAGIQAGDVIRRYASKPIYQWSDLTEATTEGTPKEQVLVEVERDGNHLNLYLPRGPLGVRLNSDRRKPGG